ncbi:uncharacterized protein LOC115767170 [Drosophila novamexicana]|uniref:uncharacterized protein LOC115767170 n=1 Tax=Drosophila novamexicana TaxID=47314 RepID=UPI0011E5CA65|nr:uncharacterized protein LOC115767170 [Drosophila novamexicana]
MCESSATTSHIRFHIQLLADKSVVLVEARGYESEIFVPVLQHGRVSLTNVICSRQPRVRASELSFHSPTSLHRCQRLANRKLTTATAGLAPKKLPSVSIARAGDVSKLRFELKLISNGNVVLVECNGYESEIFLPQISSHCVAMKRVCAGELAQCVSRKPKKERTSTKNTAAFMAATLATQAVGLSKLLVNPLHLFYKEEKEQKEQKEHKGSQEAKSQKAHREPMEQKEKLTPVKQKKRHVKHYSKEAGDA